MSDMKSSRKWDNYRKRVFKRNHFHLEVLSLTWKHFLRWESTCIHEIKVVSLHAETEEKQACCFDIVC